ncbi:hypothetical protein, partial [Paraburkholderia sp. SIMBA_054]|uniref:hypothetical protein n=1 Tax=Paraburkholderia sp. SIMBA_054 TaxID=3085795 RepID=UPI00397C5CE4
MARIFDCNGAHCGPPRGAAPALAAVLWFSPHGNARGVFIVCDVALATARFAIAARPAILAQAVLRAHVHKTISGNIWRA